MPAPTGIKSRLISTAHKWITQYWVHPLEVRVAPHLAQGERTKAKARLLRLALWLANVGRILVLDMRVGVTAWIGDEWTVLYVGGGKSGEFLQHVLFPAPPRVEERGRLSLWQVKAAVAQSLRPDTVVVCELNEAVQVAPAGPVVRFNMPDWVQQILDGADRPLEEILAAMNQTMRRNVRQLDKEGLAYIYSTATEDFDFFYHRMYLPYIRSRHGGRGAVLHSYATLTKVFQRGGLIFVQRDGSPVCGMMCVIDGDLCRAGQMGVLDGDFGLVKQGVNVALWWYMLDWARAQGVKRYDFGASRPSTANGVFNFKRQWGTHVYVHEATYTRWTFIAQQPVAPLRQHLSTLGWVTQQDGGCYQVVLDDPDQPLDAGELARRSEEACKSGLAGVLLITPDGERRIHR
jgi:hypothetical protein